MWYQNDKHCPPLEVVPGTFELMSFAASFSFLGEDVSMYMYHPFAKRIQHNIVKEFCYDSLQILAVGRMHAIHEPCSPARQDSSVA